MSEEPSKVESYAAVHAALRGEPIPLEPTHQNMLWHILHGELGSDAEITRSHHVLPPHREQNPGELAGERNRGDWAAEQRTLGEARRRSGIRSEGEASRLRGARAGIDARDLLPYSS